MSAAALPLGWRLETVTTTSGETGDKWVLHTGDRKKIVHSTLSATVGDVVCGARPDWSRAKLRRELGEVNWNCLDVPFETYLAENPDSARYLACRLRVRLLVVGLRKERDGFVRPVLDGRHSEALLERDVKDCIILLGTGGEYLGVVPELLNLPPLACHYTLTYWQRKCRPLKEILGLATEKPEPRSVSELKNFFEAENPEDFCCQIDFIAFSQGKRKNWCSESLTFGEGKNCLIVEARAGADHGLVYRETILKNESFPEQEPLPPAAPTQGDLASARNRSSSVKIVRNGLNLALDLGLVNEEEVAALSCKLGETAGALVLLYDDEKCPRYLRYVDRLTSFGVEIGCRPNQRKRVGGFFDRVAAVSEERAAARREILFPLTSKLEKLCSTKLGSRFKNCMWNLQSSVKKQRLVVSCTGDDDLHHIKYLYGQHFYDTAKKGSKTKVHLGFTPSNDLVSIWTGSCVIFNLNTYLDIGSHPEHARLLESLPEIKHLRSVSLSEEGSYRLKKRCASHCDALGAWTLQLWNSFGKSCLSDFNHELHTGFCGNLAKLCYTVVQSRLLSTCGPLDQGPEILKPFYGRLLRESCKGGFMYSCQQKISAGDGMGSGHGVKSVLELDVNTSYGFCCSTVALPGGFCVGFVNPNMSRQEGETFSWLQGTSYLCKCDGNRWTSYEFLATYATLARLSRKSPKIRSVYSNYSRRGIFNVGKFFLDLAVVFEDGGLGLWNFDPQYTHSCDHCPPLDRYVNGQTHEELREKAAKRDSAILSWIASTGVQATYQVISDCHDLLYSHRELRRACERDAELAHLNHLYPDTSVLDTRKMTEWLLDHRKNPELCFLAWMTGGLSKELKERYSAFVITPSQKTPGGQSLLADTEETSVVVTTEHFNYLVDNFDFVPDSIDAILFFKPDRKLSSVYEKLTDLRYRSLDPLQTNFLKKVLNLSIGYFGLNEKKVSSNYLLLNGAPKNFKIAQVVPYLEEGAGQATGSLLVCSSNKKKPKKAASRPPNALAAYVTVVERGKLRLIELLNFFQKHLPPDSFRLAYSNTDGVHLAFSEEDYDLLVPESDRQLYEREKSLLISEDKIPGRFKLEWHVKNDFSYVSPQIFQYAIVGKDVSLAKWAGVSRIGAEKAYAKSCELLEKGLVSVQQERRTDKRSNLEVATKTFVHKRPRTESN